MRMPISRFAVAVAVVVVAGSALVAAGCGGKGANVSGLKFVPSSALLYVSIDTDFDGDGWTRMKEIASAFPGGEEAVEEMVTEFLSDAEEDDVNWEKDIEPWLGDNAGAAAFGADLASRDADAVFWIEVSDEDALQSFIDDGTSKVKTTEVAGRDVSYEEAEDVDTYWVVEDGVLLLGNTKGALDDALTAKDDDKSITDNKGFDDTIGAVSDSSLVTVYLNGAEVADAFREGIEEEGGPAGTQASEALAESDTLGNLGGMAFGVVADDTGIRVSGIATVSGDADPEDVFGENGELEAMNGLPANALAAIGVHGVGAMIERTVSQIAESDSGLADQLSQVEAGVGADVESVSKLLGNDMAIAVVGNAAGMPGIGAVSTLEDEEEAQTTLDALLSFARLSGSAPITTVKVTGTQVTAQSITINGTTVILAVSDGRLVAASDVATVAALLNDGDTLGDSDAFSDTLKDADAPDDVSAMMFVNVEAAKDILGTLAALSGGASADSIEAIGNISAWQEITDDGLAMELVIPVDTDE